MTEVLDIPTRHIIPGDNDRTTFDSVSLAELADSIQANGLAQPITVRSIGWKCSGCKKIVRQVDTPCDCSQDICPIPERLLIYQIVAGERRFRAISQVLKRETVPCIVRYWMTDEEASAIMLMENISRKDLDPVDEAEAYQKRVEHFGWSPTLIAGKCGVSVDRVKKRLKLLKVRTDILHLVRSGNFPSGHAEALSILDHNRQMIAARPLIEGQNISLRQFKGIVDKLYAEQSQETLLSLALWGGNAAPTPIITARPVEVLAMDDLPPMKVTYNTNTGEAIFGYIADLQAAGLAREAQVAATILFYLSKLNLARLPVQIAQP
jgi:ParB/RepB/Spo0J family partition protein